MKPKIGAYCRCSTTDQTNASQRHAIREWAKANHVPASELKFYEDKKTGTTIDRPQLHKLLWAVDKQRVDTVVVFRLDRLARNLKQGLELLSSLGEKGIRVVSISENIDFGNSTGRLISSILLAVSAFERESLRERQSAGIAAAKANGTHCGRPRNEKKLSQIRKLYDEGVPAQKIAEKLKCTRSNVYTALKKTKELKRAKAK